MGKTRSRKHPNALVKSTSVIPAPAAVAVEGAARFQPSQAYLAHLAKLAASQPSSSSISSAGVALPPPPTLGSAALLSAAIGQVPSASSDNPYPVPLRELDSYPASMLPSTDSSRAETPAGTASSAYTHVPFPPPPPTVEPQSSNPPTRALAESCTPIAEAETIPETPQNDPVINASTKDEEEIPIFESTPVTATEHSSQPAPSLSRQPVAFATAVDSLAGGLDPPESPFMVDADSFVAGDEDGDSYVSDEELIQEQLVGNPSRPSLANSTVDNYDQDGEDSEGSSEMHMSSGSDSEKDHDEFEIFHDDEIDESSDEEDSEVDVGDDEMTGLVKVESSGAVVTTATESDFQSRLKEQTDSSLPLPPSPSSLLTRTLPSSSRKRPREDDDELDSQDSGPRSRSPSPSLSDDDHHDADDDEEEPEEEYEEGEIPDFFTTTIKTSRKNHGASTQDAWKLRSPPAEEGDSHVGPVMDDTVEEGEWPRTERDASRTGELGDLTLGEEDMDMSFADLPNDLVGDPSKRAKGKISLSALGNGGLSKASYTRKQLKDFSPATPVQAKVGTVFNGPTLDGLSYKPSPIQPPQPVKSKAIYVRPLDSISTSSNPDGSAPATPTLMSPLLAAVDAPAVLPGSKAVYERRSGAPAPSKANQKPNGVLPLSASEKATRLPSKLFAAFSEEFTSVEQASAAKIFLPSPRSTPVVKSIKGPAEDIVHGFWAAPPPLHSAKATYPAPANLPDLDPEDESRPRVHIFVDHSNILYSFLNWVRERPEAKIQNFVQNGKVTKTVMIGGKKVRIDYSTLFAILERGRKVERRVLVGSSPLWQNLEPSLEWSYEVSVLQRVSRAIIQKQKSPLKLRTKTNKAAVASHTNHQQLPLPVHTIHQHSHQPLHSHHLPLPHLHHPQHSQPHSHNQAMHQPHSHSQPLLQQHHPNQQSPHLLLQPHTFPSQHGHPPPPPHIAPDANGLTKEKSKRGVRGGRKKRKMMQAEGRKPGAPPQKRHQQQPLLHNQQSQQSQQPPPQSTRQMPVAKQSKEQGVDELLHLKILESLLDFPPDPTSSGPAPLLVLATGDANASDYNPTGFLGCVRRALERGWDVEIIAFPSGTSTSWLGEQAKEAAAGVGRGKLKVVDLAVFAEELIL